MRTVVLVDGEHYPPVTRWGIETAIERGHEVVGAVYVGGIEKIDPTALPDLGIPTIAAGEDRMADLARAIDDWAPGVVLDLSDEPVLGYRERMELAAVALSRGVRYRGADFELAPPTDGGPPIDAPTLAVIGTGKRTGKT
ncbi:MAG TPA: 2,3-diphosphoglycerate synthetase, partial [Actinomycetota bacterium]